MLYVCPERPANAVHAFGPPAPLPAVQVGAVLQ